MRSIIVIPVRSDFIPLEENILYFKQDKIDFSSKGAYIAN